MDPEGSLFEAEKWIGEMKLAMVEIDEGSLMVTIIGTMIGALVTLIFCYLAFRVSLESRLKDLEHQVETLQDLEVALLAQEDRIRDLEMEASRLEALPSLAKGWYEAEK